MLYTDFTAKLLEMEDVRIKNLENNGEVGASLLLPRRLFFFIGGYPNI